MREFSKRPKNVWNEYGKKCGLAGTKDFIGEVWLDDVRIKYLKSYLSKDK